MHSTAGAPWCSCVALIARPFDRPFLQAARRAAIEAARDAQRWGLVLGTLGRQVGYGSNGLALQYGQSSIHHAWTCSPLSHLFGLPLQVCTHQCPLPAVSTNLQGNPRILEQLKKLLEQQGRPFVTVLLSGERMRAGCEHYCSLCTACSWHTAAWRCIHVAV